MSSYEDKEMEEDEEEKQNWYKGQQIGIKNSLEQLKQIYEVGVNYDHDVDRLMDISNKIGIHYLTQLRHKLQEEDFKIFMKSLRLVTKAVNDSLLEKNKKPVVQYILVDGTVSYCLRPTNQELEQSEVVGFVSVGFLVYPQIFMNPKSTNLSIKCQSQCIFLCFNQEIFSRYLKKISIKQTDKLCEFLHQIPLLHKIPVLNLRKYLSFFLPKVYKYNDVVYESHSEKQTRKFQTSCRSFQPQTISTQIINSNILNDPMHNKGAQIYFIKAGEAQVYGRIKKGSKTKSLKILALQPRQCFGIEQPHQNSSEKINYLVRSTVDKLQVFSLNRKIFQIIQIQNPIIKQSFEKQKKRITTCYELIMKRNRKVLKVNMQVNPSSSTNNQLSKSVRAFYNLTLNKTCDKTPIKGDINNAISTINNWSNNRLESNKTALSNFFPPFFNSPSNLNSTGSQGYAKEQGKITAKSLRMSDERKRRKAKINKKTLAWWGLADNLGKQHKYRIPKLHNQRLEKEDKQNRVVLMDHKIRELKNRIFQSEAEQDNRDSVSSQRQFRSKTNGYIPKIKARVHMFDARPKAIDMGQFIKKKLVNYAKNTSSFCDRLNLS